LCRSANWGFGRPATPKACAGRSSICSKACRRKNCFSGCTWTAAQRDSEWAKFREAYRDVFPKELPAEAATMRFIAFEKDWTPIAIPGPGYRPSHGKLIWSWPKTYGLEPFLKQRLQ